MHAGECVSARVLCFSVQFRFVLYDAGSLCGVMYYYAVDFCVSMHSMVLLK